MGPAEQPRDAPGTGEGRAARPRRGRAASTAALLAAGFYGGFAQAGVGFLLLAALGGALGYDLVRANALKLACTLVFGVVALAVFVVAGQVEWLPGVLLAACTALGSQLGVRFAIDVRQDVLRWIVLACVIATCAAALVKG